MSNVLSFDEKKKLDRRTRARFILVGSSVLATAGAIAILALLPSYVSVRVAEASLQNSQADAERNIATDQSKVSEAQALLTLLKPIAHSTSTPTTVVRSALALRPAGVYVTSITYSGGPKGAIVLSGTADRRSGTSAYRDALEKSGLFTSVSVPVSALVGTQDGRFSITLSGIF